MNKNEFTQVIGYLVSAYPAATISGVTTKLYFEHLKDIPFEIMEKAVTRVVETSKFFPSIAELREVCLKESKPEYSQNTTDAMEILNTAVSNYGYYKVNEATEYIKQKSPVLYKIVKAIGFRNICGADFKIFRTEIEKLYKECADDAMKNEQTSEITMSRVIKLGKKMEINALAIQEYNFY